MMVHRWTRYVAVALAAIALAGCVTPRIDWSARLGHYTYDQAVKDFGPPDKDAKLSDGTLVAEWLTQRGGMIVQPEGFYPTPYGLAGPLPPTPYSETPTPSYYLRLTFAPNGTLEAAKDVAK
jgi:hypothetical protein